VVFNSIKDCRAKWFSFAVDSKSNVVSFRVRVAREWIGLQ
jgi:hypothetical protein